MIPKADIDVAFVCHRCGWCVISMIGTACPRCLTDGMDVVVDEVEINKLRLAWCAACETWHGEKEINRDNS